MGSFSWVHLISAILIIIFAATGTTWLVIVLAAIIAIMSIFGVCSCGSKARSYYKKKEIKVPIKKRRR
jgi:hypothetical protein